MATSRARPILGLVTLAAAALLAVVNGAESDVRADPPLRETASINVTCPPFNLFNPDAGPNGVPVGCNGYRAIRCENETSTAVYWCGATGCTVGNATSRGLKRCPTCTGGFAFNADLYNGQVRCISGTADAGAIQQCLCGK
jgi:hypothetical protein